MKDCWIPCATGLVLMFSLGCSGSNEVSSNLPPGNSATTPIPDERTALAGGDRPASPETSAKATPEKGTPVEAFFEFNSEEVCVSFHKDWITVQSSGLPDHTSPYWAEDNSLYIDPVTAVPRRMSPGKIRARGYALTVPADPQFGQRPYTTGLGAIGIATTGAPIFNEREGPTGSLSAGIASGFDYAGAHMGPTGYHYHLESEKAEGSLSHDDSKLVGIMQDGFLLYGRKCSSTGTYPTDLDASGGHTCGTQHGDHDFYHYHVINRTFVLDRVLLFGADLKGTPYAISR